MSQLLRKNNNFIISYNFLTGKFKLYDIKGFSELGLLSKCSEYENIILNLTEEEQLTLSKYQISCQDIDPSLFHGPLVTGIMLYNNCNLRCKYCIANNAHGYSETVIIDQYIDKLIEQLTNSSVLGILLSGGEPTLNAHLTEILRALLKYNFYITLDTNGVFLSTPLKNILLQKDLRLVPRVSLDSHLGYIHNSVRGEFDRTMDNLYWLRKNEINVRINTVLHKFNISHMNEFAKFLIKMGIKQWHIFKLQPEFAPPELHINDKECARVIGNLRRSYGQEINIICKFTKESDGFSSFVIDSELSCFSTKNSQIKKVIFGNILSSSLSDIWGGTPIEYKQQHINKYLK